ncbi:MAG TPA: flagellar protein FlaF [Methanomicrobiales archaeon]|nr:flagellar protein FlaF [Methanomicrobiales archaeon]
MGAGTIIATAIAIMLLIVTGYVLIGGTLTTARTIAMAQRDAADQQVVKANTRIEILNATLDAPDGQTFVEVKNAGSVTISDFAHMDIYLLQGGAPYVYLNASGALNWTYTISPDAVNPTFLDPGEVANITVKYDNAHGDPSWVKVITGSGVYTSAYIPP